MTALPTVAQELAPAPPVFHVVPDKPKQDHLSYSQVRSYAGCSLKWWYSRRYEPEYVPAALVFGKAWHAAVERYYQLALEGRAQNLTALLEAFFTEYEQEKKPLRYGKTESMPTPEQIAKMLQVFLAAVTPGKVIAIEQAVRCPLGEGLPDLLGYIDLVEIVREESGGFALHIVDFKTCGRSPEDIDPDQLVLYEWALRQTGLLAEFDLPLRLRYDYIVKTKEPRFGSLPVRSGGSAAGRVLEKIRQCWKGMRAEIVYPCPGWQCAGCGYRNRCGHWPGSEDDGLRSDGSSESVRASGSVRDPDAAESCAEDARP